jgi:wobble nucleotide-excising tRNase
MLKEVSIIKNVGVYQNYRWDPNLDPFKKFNLIYGWNYAGKTTLSRIFRAIELGELHKIATDAEFKITSHDDNNCTHEFIRKENIKVFNSDYVTENVKWEDGTVSPILILGEDSIQLEQEKRRQEALLAQKNNQKANKLQERKSQIDEERNIRTTTAREVGNLLGIRPFDMRHLERYINLSKPKEDYYQDILSDDKFDSLKSQALSIDRKSLLTTIRVNEVPSSTMDLVNEILNKSIKDQLTISDLLDDRVLSNWVKQGIQLHEEEDKCKFCGNKITGDLIIRLKEHFSEQYTKYKNELESELSKFSQHLSQLKTTTLPSEDAFYSQYKIEYTDAKSNIELQITQLSNEINEIIEIIKNRLENIFDINIRNEIEINTRIDITTINSVIVKNNQQSTDFDTKKDEAIESVKKHLVAESVVDEQLHLRKVTLSVLADELISLESDITNCNSEIERIELIISSSTRGVERINTFLKLYFGKEDIKIQLKNENKYELVRDSHPVTNLSEGEKTAIAFAYFIASLNESGNRIEDTIVYIDDPISSLDSNHLFNTYAFIKDTFYEFDNSSNPKHKCKCKQLFISTHNFEFFNLLKDWFSKLKKEFHGHYLIEKDNDSRSKLKQLPDILFKHKSEYSYLFSMLYSFSINPVQDFSHLHSLPNIIRRFLESFMTFKYLTSINIEENLHLVIPDPIDAEKVRKFAHYYSHNLSTTRLMQLSNVSECSSIVQIVLDSVKLIDVVHYEALVQKVQ